MQENKQTDIFALPPDQFKMTLQELEQQGLEKDKINYIAAEYQKRQGAVKDPFTEPNKQLQEQGRERANYLPVSKPQGTSVIDAFKEGSLKPAVPGAVTEGASALADAINAPANIMKGVPYSKEQLTGAGVGVAAASAAGGAAMPVPKGSVRIFGGLNARGANKGAWKQAKQLEDEGMQNWQIERETGWFKDPVDHKWRFELDDSKAKFLEPDDGLVQRAMSGDANVSEVFDNPDLYQAYPEIKGYKIKLQDMPKEQLGGFYPREKAFILNTNLDDDKAREVMLHEMQHAVQGVEGFANGANPRTTYDQLQKVGELEGKSLSEKSQLAFKYYEGKGGEIEARLVEDRANLTPEERKMFPATLNRDAMRNIEYQNAFGETSLKRGVSDILIDDQNAREVLARDPFTKELLDVPLGTDIGGGFKYEGFGMIDPKKLAYTEGRLPQRGPEFRDSDGRIMAIFFEDENGVVKPRALSDFINSQGVDIENWR